MKNVLIMLVVVTMAIGGCAQPINNNYRSRKEERRAERLRRQSEIDRHDRDRDHRPNAY